MPKWTTLHDVTFLYLFLAEKVDHDLTRPERQVIVQRLSQWTPGEPSAYVTKVLREAHDAVNGAAPATTARQIIQSLKKAPLSSSQRHEIWHDLVHIARSDGGVADGEFEFLQKLAIAWDIDGAPRA